MTTSKITCENVRDKVTRVTVGWDDQPGVEPGWYCQSWEGEELDGDSMKAFFPVSVDDFGQDQYTELARALRESFPNAEIDRK